MFKILVVISVCERPLGAQTTLATSTTSQVIWFDSETEAMEAIMRLQTQRWPASHTVTVTKLFV